MAIDRFLIHDVFAGNPIPPTVGGEDRELLELIAAEIEHADDGIHDDCYQVWEVDEAIKAAESGMVKLMALSS